MLRHVATLLVFLTLTAPPVAAAGRELGPSAIEPALPNVRALDIAFAGGRFLTVWSTHGAIMGELSDARGAIVSETSFVIVPAVEASSIALVATGDSFALFWSDVSRVLHMTDVDLSGRLTLTRTLALPRSISLHAAYDGVHFLVTALPLERFRSGDEAFLLNRAGDVLVGGIALGEGSTVHIGVRADSFVAFTVGRSLLVAHEISADGLMAETILRSGVSELSVVTNGSLLIWSERDGTRSRLMSGVWSGDALGPVHVLAMQTGSMFPVHLERSGDGYVLAVTTFHDEGLTMLSTLILGGDGTPIDADESRAVTIGRFFPRAASSGESFVVATSLNSFSGIAIVAITRDGTVSAPVAGGLAVVNQSSPQLATDGGAMVAIWTEGFIRSRLRAATLGRDLEPNGDHWLDAGLAAVDIASSGTAYLAVYRSANQLLARRLTHHGTPIEGPVVLAETSPDEAATVTWARDRWVVVWSLAGDLYSATVSSSGVASPSRQLQLDETTPTGYVGRSILSMALADDGDQLLLVWTESYLTGFPTILSYGDALLAARLRRDGRAADPHPIRLGSVRPRRVSLASGGDGFLLITDEAGGTLAQVVDARTPGLLMQPVRTLFAWPAASDVTWSGSDYVVALTYRGFFAHVAVARLDREAQDVPPLRGTETPDSFGPPSVASAPAYGAIVALQEIDEADGQRAVIYAAREMAVLPPPPNAPSNVRSRTTTDHRNEVTWDAPTGPVELYVLEGRSLDGEALSAIKIAGDSLSFITALEPLRIRAFHAGGPSAWTGVAPIIPLRRRTVRP